MKRFWMVRWLDEFGAPQAREHAVRFEAIIQLRQLQDRLDIEDPRLWECTEIQC